MVFHKKKNSIEPILFVKYLAIIDVPIHGGNADGWKRKAFCGKSDCD